ncbi:MAG: PEP-CTERM sorting domain-containing protein [Planctomycetales bacterium]|nr:PEP-CTERM sorting domain-containing protein [Planctomycetales bacterium]
MSQLRNPRRLSALIALLAAIGLTSSTHGAVIQSVETDIAPAGGDPGVPYTPGFPSGVASSTDVLEGKLPIASSGNFTLEASTGVAALTNGLVDTFYGTGGADSVHSAYATAGDGNFVTYSLSGAYDISSIVIYGGWNDGGRDAQHYDLQVSSDGVSFSTLTTVDINPGVQGTDVTPVSNRVAITENAAANLASSITTLRLNFLAVENGYTGYSEIDVFGTRLTIAGDVNGDGLVNLNDFVIISDNFLKTPSSPGLQGDLNFDNVVDQKDFREWRIAFGEDAVAAIGDLSRFVPEPATGSLLALAVVASLRRQRRRR